MASKAFIAGMLSAALLGTILTAHAADSSWSPLRKTSYTRSDAAQTSATDSAGQNVRPLVFSAPPREPRDVAIDAYGPIADYLSEVIGKPVVFKYPDNWLTYHMEMQKGGYDLVFDDPHFNGWRVTRLHHNTLARLPGDNVFVVAVMKNDKKVTGLKQLSGARVCTTGPSSLGTLTLLREFDNPSRQPIIADTDGWENMYKALVEGKCAAAVLPQANLALYDLRGQTKIIHKAKAFPNQAFSAGRRLSKADQEKLRQALIAPEARQPTARLREIYAVRGNLVPADRDDYADLGVLLKNIWGYYPQ